MTAELDQEQCWQAVVSRDAGQDGRFYFGVLTTGVYCRPSCAARRPLRQNVRFYTSHEAAEADGLRACLRCRPLEEESSTDEKVRQVRELLEQRPEEAWTLARLGEEVGWSAFHLQRMFRAAVGVSPKQYLNGQRLKRLRGELRSGQDVTGAIFEAGYGSLSRVYERSNEQLGMTPGQYRAGGKGVTIRWTTIESAIGLVLLGATERGICFLQFGETVEELVDELRRQYPKADLDATGDWSEEPFAGWKAGVQSYLLVGEPLRELPVDIDASRFQFAVWDYLRRIPQGRVETYAQVAAGIGAPKSARAVARACATNRVALVIPCHRVVAAGGAMGGYRWGVERKRELLAQERGATERNRGS